MPPAARKNTRRITIDEDLYLLLDSIRRCRPGASFSDVVRCLVEPRRRPRTSERRMRELMELATVARRRWDAMVASGEIREAGTREPPG